MVWLKHWASGGIGIRASLRTSTAKFKSSSLLPTKKNEIEKHIKKGLSTTLSIFIEKRYWKKLEIKLEDLKSRLARFRPGKVANCYKKQFGKAIYGEVIDDLLKESSQQAIQQKKIKIAGQPKIDLKSFGEGKDLSFQLFRVITWNKT